MAGEWPTVKVGDLADSISETHKFGKDHLIFLNTSDVLHGKILNHSYSAIREWPGQAKKSIRKGDILFSEIRPANCRWAYVDIEAGDYVVSTKLMVIRSRTHQVLPRFLYHFLTCAESTGWLQYLAESRSGTFPQITFDQVAELSVALPSIVVQSRIVTFLDAIDDKIELNRRMNQTLEQIAQAIFKSWFVDFDPVRAKAEGRQPYGMDEATAALFPDDFEESELGPAPKGWIVKQVADLGHVVCGKTPPTKDPENYGGKVPFITIPDMHGKLVITETIKTLSEKGVKTQPNKILPAYSICVSCIATPGLVVLTTQPSQTNQQINSIIPSNPELVFYYYFVMDQLVETIRGHGSGGSVFHNLNKSTFSSLKIILANTPLALSYNNLVKVMFDKIILNQKESQTLSALRDTLLPRLMSGELRVKEAEKMVEG